jgi:hypothetical protein
MLMFSQLSRRSLLRISSALAFAGVVAASHGAARVVQAVADGPNPIVVENDLPGTTDNWEVFDPVDPNARGVGDPSIQGFATDISVNRNSTIAFKIKLDAAAESVG